MSETTRRLILGFDAGCASCSDLARRVEETVGNKLEMLSLHNPQVEQWRRQALGENAPWAPTLIEIEGTNVKAWTGLRMSAALSRRLGPVATWRLMQVLGEPDAAHGTEIPGSDREAGSISRGQFLKGLASGLAALAILPAGAFASPGGPHRLRHVPENAAVVGRLKRTQAVQEISGTFGRPNWNEVSEFTVRANGRKETTFIIPYRTSRGTRSEDSATATYLVIEGGNGSRAVSSRDVKSIVMREHRTEDGKLDSITWSFPNGQLIETTGLGNGRMVSRTTPAREASLYRERSEEQTLIAQRSRRGCFRACLGETVPDRAYRACLNCGQGNPFSCGICSGYFGYAGIRCAYRCFT